MRAALQHQPQDRPLCIRMDERRSPNGQVERRNRTIKVTPANQNLISDAFKAKKFTGIINLSVYLGRNCAEY